MKLTLHRQHFTDNSTIGELSIDGVKECDTLEDTCRLEKVPKGEKPAIPVGTYRLVILPSARYGRNMPRLLKVMEHDNPTKERPGILIHWGNYPRDTMGCILVGKYDKTRADFITSSRATFARLFDRLNETNEEIFITITGSRAWEVA